MKNAFQEIMDLVLQLDERERRALVRLLRQLEASSDLADKHWENYM